jgi:hypothetical protein
MSRDDRLPDVSGRPKGGTLVALPRRGLTWRVFLTCWAVYTVFWTPYIVREHFPALAIAERGTLNVETYLGWTDDIFAGPNGGAYINNNPGASLAGAVPLVLLRPVLASIDRWNGARPRNVPNNDEGELLGRAMSEGREYYFLAVAFVTVALVMAPATAGAAAYLCSRVTQAGVPARSAALVAILYGLATPVLYRTAHLNHNLLVADAGIIALLVLWDPASEPLAPRRAVIAGSLAGYALLCDYSGVVVVIVTVLYVWLRSAGVSGSQRLRVVAACVAGILPFVLALAIYQAWAFGSLYRPSQHFMTPTSPTSRGYRGFDWPSVSLLWANFFDPRFGLFAYCPALILALAAPFVKRVRYRLPKRETWILLLYFWLFVLFCAANQYSWLQPLTGFRYLTPVIPGLALLAMQVAQALPRTVQWLLAGTALTQSLIMAGAHENNLRLSVTTLFNRHFQLPWMIRFGHVGLPLTGTLPAVTFLLLVLVLGLIWLKPVRGADSHLEVAKVAAN